MTNIMLSIMYRDEISHSSPNTPGKVRGCCHLYQSDTMRTFWCGMFFS